MLYYSHLATKCHADAFDDVHKHFLHSGSSSGHRQIVALSTAHTFNQTGYRTKNTHATLYNNIINMPGKYNSQQVPLKNVKQYNDYIPYVAHSLNPAGSKTLHKHFELSWFLSC